MPEGCIEPLLWLRVEASGNSWRHQLQHVFMKVLQDREAKSAGELLMIAIRSRLGCGGAKRHAVETAETNSDVNVIAICVDMPRSNPGCTERVEPHQPKLLLNDA